MFFLQQKNVSFRFLSPSLNPCHPFSRWASLACRPLSLFLYPSLALYLIRGHDNISKINTLDNTDTEIRFSLSVFVFIDSIVVSALEDADGYAISRQHNLEVAFGLPYLLIKLFYIGMPVVRTNGLSGGVRSRDYQIFSDG